MLFRPDIIYPQDRNGRYVELEGKIIKVDEFVAKLAGVDVQTEHGLIRAYIENYSFLPEVGWKARMKYYDWGGGWYPDPIITAWWKDDKPVAVVPLPLPE